VSFLLCGEDQARRNLNDQIFQFQTVRAFLGSQLPAPAQLED